MWCAHANQWGMVCSVSLSWCSDVQTARRVTKTSNRELEIRDSRNAAFGGTLMTRARSAQSGVSSGWRRPVYV
eukprot:6389788-Prymnesium_polylepis.2